MLPRYKVFFLILFISRFSLAQDASSDVLVRAIDVAQGIYSGNLKIALTTVAMKRNCIKSFPELKNKLEANLSSSSSGLGKKVQSEIQRLEASKDPYVKGLIDGAVIATYEKDVLEFGCKALAGVNP